MQTNNPLLDDLARVATGALGAFTDMRSQIEAQIRDQTERLLGRMDLVTREEFEAVKTLAVKARADQDALIARIVALEAQLGAQTAAAHAAPAPAQHAPTHNAPAKKSSAKAPPST